MKLRGLKKVGTKPEVVKTKSGKLIETGETVAVFAAPDGTRGTMSFFHKEVEKGRLHGCLACF